MITAKTGWKHLQQMFDMGLKAVEEIWFETAKSYESGISMWLKIHINLSNEEPIVPNLIP